MKDTDIIEEKFGEIELKLLRAKVIKEVEKILEQVSSNQGEDFLYPIIDFNNQSDRIKTLNPLIEGEFMGHMYEICTNGMHPTAYVRCGVPSYIDKDECKDLPVHGGCTYTGNRSYGGIRPDADGAWVGWDYGHYGDCIMDMGRAYPPFVGAVLRNGKKWTATEVMLDVIKAILHIEETS